jgi:DNA-binding NtrC family response regulator
MSLATAETETDAPPFIDGMIGTSDPMRAVYELTRQVAASSATVLLTGETGTGKELVARAIHELSPRASGPFIRVNCGALSESLLESELFGHVKGAFTSAVENRTGRFEAAHGGTIFLDEINSVSYKLQVKLLRVLQEHEFERVGDTKTVTVDCRIVAATNRDLLDEIDAGRFREDLYYRLNVIPIYLPPLRDRPDDIPPLVDYFVQTYAARNAKAVPGVDPDTIRILQGYAWPGNVRELQNYVERAIVLCTGGRLHADLFPPHVRGLAPVRIGRQSVGGLEGLCQELVTLGITEAGSSADDLYQRVVSLVEKELIGQVLKLCQGVQTKAATRLGINRNTLHKKIEDFGLQEESQ